MLAGRHSFIELQSSFEAMYFIFQGELVYVLQEVFRQDAFCLAEGHLLLIVHQGFDNAIAGLYAWVHMSAIFVRSSFIRVVVSRNCRLRRRRTSSILSVPVLFLPDERFCVSELRSSPKVFNIGSNGARSSSRLSRCILFHSCSERRRLRRCSFAGVEVISY